MSRETLKIADDGFSFLIKLFDFLVINVGLISIMLGILGLDQLLSMYLEV